jgi:hypothetical protein
LLLAFQTPEFGSGNGSGFNIESGYQNISPGSWHQVVVRRNGTTVDLFVDGQKVASGTVVIANPTGPFAPTVVLRAPRQPAPR